MTIPVSMAFIEETEALVASNVHESIGFGRDLVYRGSDVVLAMMYQLGPSPGVDTPEGVYRFFAFERVGELPYTVRSVDILCSRGHYPEAVVLTRFMVEAFVQLRYFAKYPTRLLPHLTATGAKGRVRFVEMVDEFAPGFYGSVYARLLSGVAHSGMALSALLPSTPSKADEPAKTDGRYGCAYNQVFSAFVTNLNVAIMRGFLEHFLVFFPAAEPPPNLAYERQGLLSILAQFVANVLKGDQLALWEALTTLPPNVREP